MAQIILQDAQKPARKAVAFASASPLVVRKESGPLPYILQFRDGITGQMVQLRLSVEEVKLVNLVTQKHGDT